MKWGRWIVIGIVAVAAAGCGGGGGSPAPSPTGKGLTTQQATAPLRNARSAFAITGIGLTAVTRAVTAPMGSRAAILLKIGAGRATAPLSGYDPNTQLYYAITNNADGSGSENLFTDSADHNPAGSFVWGVPQWHNGVPNSYPAVYQLTYAITAGPFAGCHGTLVVTLNDNIGHNGALHLLNTNKLGEHCDCTESVVDSALSAVVNIALLDGSSCSGKDNFDAGGDVQGTYSFNDGDTETLNIDPNGDGLETLCLPDGSTDATGTFNSSGTDNIQYSDGSTADVDVDTGDATDSSGSDDSSDPTQAILKRRSVRNTF